MLAGREDAEIVEHFRKTAFPAEEEVDAVLGALESVDGMSTVELERVLNLRRTQIDRVLKIVSVERPAPVIKVGAKWRRTPVRYKIDQERIRQLTMQRETEWQEIQRYIDTSTCLMAFLRRALDDREASDCGRCANCLGRYVADPMPDFDLTVKATRFLKRSDIPFEPRKRADSNAFPVDRLGGLIPPEHAACEGRILSRWGDAGWGATVAAQKRNGSFADELVQALAEMIRKRWRPAPDPKWLTCIPSQRNPRLVPCLAVRLARELGLPFHHAVEKLKDNQPQKEQENGFHQCKNLDGAFRITGRVPSGPVLLVDDVIDSGWTMFVVAALLRRAGSGAVFPVALASTSTG